MSSFVCDNCQKQFSSKQNYDYHINKNVCTQGNFERSHCGRKFTTHSSMYRHKKHSCKMRHNAEAEKSAVLNRLIEVETQNKKITSENIALKKLAEENKILKQIFNNFTIVTK